MRKLAVLCTCLLLTLVASSQKEEKITDPKLVQDILEKTGIDSVKFLKSAAEQACPCIDSVAKAENDPKLEIDGFASCIDKQVVSYQLALKLWRSMRDPAKHANITLASDKDSREYKNHYYQIESYLTDNCKALKTAISSNDVANDKSFSKNEEAMDAYDKGVKLLRAEKHAEGIPYFQKAVEIDDQFVFAWDNLGICYRKTMQLDKAESAYKSSLKIDPSGRTALQNLAVVYQYQKKVDEAIETYKELAKYYPEDPEVHYGIGIIYLGRQNYEKALDEICQAYLIYVKMKSPYRSDAEKAISQIYQAMKKDGKEDVFFKILKEHDISTN